MMYAKERNELMLNLNASYIQALNKEMHKIDIISISCDIINSRTKLLKENEMGI